MSLDRSVTTTTEMPDLAALTHLRPVEIKTYHRTSYSRISPSNTLDGKSKTALITAGATGIGFAIAESFAKAGIQRLVLIQRRAEVLSVAKQTLESEYPDTKVTTYEASVTDFDRISAILKEVGKIDILISNAGVSHPFVPSKDVTVTDFKATFETNVVGAFHIIKEFLALKSSAPRVVIYTSSAAGQIVRPGNIGYGPSKAAANQMIQHLAMENVDTDVTIQAFHPGLIYTQSSAELAGVDENALEWEDVNLPGDFAVWLASTEASFLAGRFVWAQWDVDELIALKGRIGTDPSLLTMTLAL